MKIFVKAFVSLLLLFAQIVVCAQWQQLNSDVYGLNEYDYLGRSVSSNDYGDIIAVGAYGYDSFRGQVKVFQSSSGGWIQLGGNIDGEYVGDYQGYSVCLNSDGTVVAIGAPHNDGYALDAGQVRVFHYSAGVWTQIGSDIDGEAADDLSGNSISLSDDGQIVAIGAYANDGNGSYAGHVRVFQLVAGSWLQMGNDIDGDNEGDCSGISVSLSSSGLILAIGANGNSANGNVAGQTRIFEYNAGNWVQMGNDIYGSAAYDGSGRAVSLNSDGSFVAIGALNNGNNPIVAGNVRVFNFLAGSWIQVGSDINGEAANDYSGSAVSLSSDGSIVAIGAPDNDGGGNNSGHTRVFHFNQGNWQQIGQDIDGDAASDASGCSVSLNSDGSMLVVGALNNREVAFGSGQAKAYVFNTYIDTTIFACEEYVSPSGNYTWNGSGVYQDTIPNSSGIDSIFTIHLIVHLVPIYTTVSGSTLTVFTSGLFYQWVDCLDGYSPIAGETNQSFSPAVDGSYAALIDDGSCVDTSNCFTITGAGLANSVFDTKINIFPSPTTGVVSIEGDNIIKNIEVLNLQGQILCEVSADENRIDFDVSNLSKGFYFFRIMTLTQTYLRKFEIQ